MDSKNLTILKDPISAACKLKILGEYLDIIDKNYPDINEFKVWAEELINYNKELTNG